MFPAPTSNFLAEETKHRGRRPRLILHFFPHSLVVGLGLGMGIFVGCSFVAPDRILVDDSFASASWTSPDMDAGLEGYPARTTISWVEVLTGYSLLFQFKTATTLAGLATAAWQTAVNGDEYSFYQYYKFQLLWSGLPCLITETGVGEPRQLYFTETEESSGVGDSSGNYESYVVEGSGPTYVETIGLASEYLVNPRDVMPKSVSMPRLAAPQNFSDLVAGEMAVMLWDGSGKFDPNSSNFVFAGEDWWFIKNIRASFGWQRRGFRVYDTFTFFEGRILRFGPRKVSYRAVPQVQVYAQSIITLMFRQPAVPRSLEALAYGDDLWLEATELTNDNPSPPAKYADFETGDLSQLSGVEEGPFGGVSIEVIDPLIGSYSCLTAVSAAANDKAVAKLELNSPSLNFQAKGRMRVNARPTVPEAQSARLFGLYEIDGISIFDVYVENDSRLTVKYGSTWWETSGYLSAYDEIETDWGFAFMAANPGILVVWLGGQEIFRKDDYNFSARRPFGAWFGVRTGAAAETWSLSWDGPNGSGVEIWSTYFPVCYQVKGAPYMEINAVYVDCIIVTEEVLKRTRRQQRLDRRLRRSIKGGRNAPTSNYAAYPEWGAVAWVDWANPPSGQVMFNLKKTEPLHVMDLIEALLGEWDLTAAINAASFATAKALIPQDTINLYFEAGPVRAELLREILASYLLGFYEEAGQIYLWAYTGASLETSDPDMELEAVNRASRSHTWDVTELIPTIRGRWGWHDRDASLETEVTDDELESLLGEDEEELDLTVGQPVMTRDKSLVQRKVEALAKMHSRPVERLEISAFLEAARLQLYDVVSVEGREYRVFEKELDYIGRKVNLLLLKHEGLEV